MDADQIKRFALFLYEENQTKRTQLDEMIARLDEIGKDLKESNKKIGSLTNAPDQGKQQSREACS